MTSVAIRSHRIRSLALVASAALVVATVSTLGSGSAVADSAPPDAGTPKTVSGDSLPTPQINGVVWDQEIVGDIVYVGGNFTTARPAGAAPGVSEVTRAGLLSYRLSTGELTNWAPTLNAQAD